MAKKVLVIEDDISTRRLVEFLLKREGFDVIGAKNGEEGMLLFEQNPALFIIDIMLPGMSGLDIIDKIKQNKSLRKKPIMVLSALGEEAIVSAALKKGADEYIVKPFATAFFTSEVKRLIEL